MPDVVVEGVTVRRAGVVVLDDVSFTAPAGRVTVVIGPSGAGKTSLVRALARLDPIERGIIRFGDRDVTHDPPGTAGSTLTFQHAALFPHLDVGRNVGFPLALRRVDLDEVNRRVGEELRSLRIGALLHRRPSELSVGEAQMVQLARALVTEPEVILLDEPFAALEGERSRVLRSEIRMLQERLGATIVASTNDPDDARRFADGVVVLDAGRVVQVGDAADVFERPETVAAAHLTGDATVDVVTVEAGDGGWWLRHPAFSVRVWAPVFERHVGRRLQLVTRPEWWELDPRSTVVGTVTRGIRWGGDATLTVDVAGHDVMVRMQPIQARHTETGELVRLRLAHWVAIDPLDGRRIEVGR